MRNVAILTSMLLFYGGPFLIVSVWLVRFRQRPESPRWRWVMSWVSLSLATVAVGALIGTLTGVPPDIEESVERLNLGTTTISAFLAGSFMAALMAKGRGRAWTLASVLIIPLYWLITFGIPSLKAF